MAGSFSHILSPIKIGPIKLRNRILISAHVPRLAVDNKPGAAYIAYHRARARGGAGLQLTGATPVHPSGMMGTTYSLANLDDGIVPGYLALSDAVHEESGRILAQLGHGAATLAVSGVAQPLWAPSAIQSQYARETPRPMGDVEIAEMVQAYASAAGRTRIGGMDGVEILMAFGFLPGAFLSPFSNCRDDAYGGSLENRMRFPLMLIDAVRAELGADQILGLRIPGSEQVAGGLTSEDMQEISVCFAGHGKIDYLNVIAGTNYSKLQRMEHWAPTPQPHGIFASLAAAIKKKVTLPVFVAGRVTSPLLAEHILKNGQADMVAMTRAHIADPDIVQKIIADKITDIRPCVGANVCITLSGGPLRCFHNPEPGRDKVNQPIEPSKNRKKIAIIGGGVAGLEAARIAAMRGHWVTIYEASDCLGGRTSLWATAPLTKEFEGVVSWRQTQLENLQVRTNLGKRVTPNGLMEIDADIFVLATGSKPAVWAVPEGAENSNVRVVDPDFVLTNLTLFQGVVIIRDEGGGRTALAAAEALAPRVERLILITTDFAVGETIDPVIRNSIYKYLLKHGAEFWPGEIINHVKDRLVFLQNQFSDRKTTLNNVETLVDWRGRIAQTELESAIRNTGRPFHFIGDALAPRTVAFAIAEGARIGELI
jgi:2,4-dienoyl-CoA reductase-like NADH-dependent reductase (Old Yellow Enzyme family)